MSYLSSSSYSWDSKKDDNRKGEGQLWLSPSSAWSASPPPSPIFTATSRQPPPPRYSNTFIILLVLLLNAFMILQHRSNLSALYYPSSSAAASSASSNGGTQSCELCVLEPGNELCQYGMDNVRLSRGYEGSGFRIRRFLQKAMRREPLKVGIIGASVSLGHGVAFSGNRTWHETFQKDFQKQFPRAQFYKGLTGGSGSQFFSYCYDTLIAKDMDLYLIELDINNEPGPKTFDDDDALYRTLLGLPQQPAVLRVSVPALLFQEMVRGAASGLLTSEWFDVPVISLRNVLHPLLLKHPEKVEEYFAHYPKSYDNGATDLRHISWLGHNMLGDLVSIYFREQVCETKRRLELPPAEVAPEWSQQDVLGEIPRLRLTEGYSERTSRPALDATCHFAGSSTHPLAPITPRPQWSIVAWNDKSAYSTTTAQIPLTFKFYGTNVGLFLWMTDGAGHEEGPGILECWLDGDAIKAFEVDTFHKSIISGTSFHQLFDGIKKTEHFLTCQVMQETSSGGHHVRIIGLGAQ